MNKKQTEILEECIKATSELSISEKNINKGRILAIVLTVVAVFSKKGFIKKEYKVSKEEFLKELEKRTIMNLKNRLKA